jgi:hypothetical protein
MREWGLKLSQKEKREKRRKYAFILHYKKTQVPFAHLPSSGPFTTTLEVITAI